MINLILSIAGTLENPEEGIPYSTYENLCMQIGGSLEVQLLPNKIKFKVTK